MHIDTHEVTTVIKDENNNITSTKKSISYVIYPNLGKLLKNKITGYTTDSFIGISSKSDIENYEEINI